MHLCILFTWTSTTIRQTVKYGHASWAPGARKDFAGEDLRQFSSESRQRPYCFETLLLCYVLLKVKSVVIMEKNTRGNGFKHVWLSSNALNFVFSYSIYWKIFLSGDITFFFFHFMLITGIIFPGVEQFLHFFFSFITQGKYLRLNIYADSAFRNMAKKYSYPCNRPWRPVRLWDVKHSTFSRQLAHRWQLCCQPYAPAALFTPRNITFLLLVHISVRGWVYPRA
jgi:hypothetical protein